MLLSVAISIAFEISLHLCFEYGVILAPSQKKEFPNFTFFPFYPILGQEMLNLRFH